MFFREVFRLHGLPRNIVNNRDGRFVSIFWTELFRMAGTELSPSTSYHPQTDGQTKIVNKWLEGYLRNYISAQQWAWVKWIHLGEYCYNTTYHVSIARTPFKALYGYDPSLSSTQFWVIVVLQGRRTSFKRDRTYWGAWKKTYGAHKINRRCTPTGIE